TPAVFSCAMRFRVCPEAAVMPAASTSTAISPAKRLLVLSLRISSAPFSPDEQRRLCSCLVGVALRFDGCLEQPPASVRGAADGCHEHAERVAWAGDVGDDEELVEPWIAVVEGRRLQAL